MPLSLRRLLAVSMLLLLAAAVGTILLTIQLVASQSLEHAATESLRARTAAARNRIDQEMFERLRDVSFAAESLQGQRNPDGKEHGRALIDGMVKSYPDYSWIAIVDRDGIVKTGTNGMLEGQSVAERPWFPEGLKGPFVGDVHEAVLLGKLLGTAANNQPWRFVDFSLPLTGPDGEVIGVFGAHLNWEWAKDLLHEFESQSQTKTSQVREVHREVLILDKNGLVLYGPDALLGSRFEVPSAGAQQGTWKVEDQWLLAAAPSLGYRDFKGLGWTIVLRESLDDILVPAHQMRSAILAWSLPTFVIFLIFATLIGRWIAHPLEKLSTAAGEGHFLPIVNGGYHEIVQLNDALRGMIWRLEDSKEQVERDVRARTAEIKHLTEALDAHAIVCMADAAGNITYANEKFCSISGYSSEELMGKTPGLLKSGVHEIAFYKNLWHTISSGATWQGQICNRHKNGDFYWVQSTITPTRTSTESTHRYISICTDITDVIREQEARRIAEMEADRANRAKSEFLSNMSHELRTPMNSILGFAQILDSSKKHPLDEKQKEHVRQILRGGEHLLDLINEVLDLARIEAGKLSLSIESIEVTALLDECLSVVHGQAQQRGITLVTPWSGQPGLFFVQADRLRLKQILLNLLSNAIKYNRSNEKVTVTITSVADHRIRITVQDNGLGIPADQQKDLFKPFNRLGAESSEIEGTGIGLTISQNLAQAMNGTLSFSSQPGQGSSFWIELPQAIPASHNGELESQHKTNLPSPITEGVVRKILYIEDNPSNIKLLESLIEDIEGLEMVALPNAELGLDFAEREQPDIILIDINLPGINGIEAMRHLRLNPKTEAIPVLALSADAMPTTIRKAQEAGCLEYLTKPIDIARLQTAIHEAIKKEHRD